MARLGLRRETTTVEVDTKTEMDYDVLALRRVQDHPAVRLLLERKAKLHHRLGTLETERGALQRAIVDLERSQAQAIAAEGETWQPPLEWRQAQEALKDCEAQTRMVQSGLEPLKRDIERAIAEARVEVEAALNGLRCPIVQRLAAALEGLVPDNQVIHAIERASARLLGVGQWHLFDPGLEQRLRLLERTRLLLDTVDEP